MYPNPYSSSSGTYLDLNADRSTTGMEKNDEGFAVRPPLTPSEELSGRIAAALVDAGLITERHRGDVETRVANGSAGSEEWRRWIEGSFEEQNRSEGREDAQ